MISAKPTTTEAAAEVTTTAKMTAAEVATMSAAVAATAGCIGDARQRYTSRAHCQSHGPDQKHIPKAASHHHSFCYDSG